MLKVDAWQWTRDERTENYLFLSTLAPEDPFSGIMNFHRITRLYVLRDCRTLYFLDELSPDGNYLQVVPMNFRWIIRLGTLFINFS